VVFFLFYGSKKGSGAKMLVRNIEQQFLLHFYLMKLSQIIY